MKVFLHKSNTEFFNFNIIIEGIKIVTPIIKNNSNKLKESIHKELPVEHTFDKVSLGINKKNITELKNPKRARVLFVNQFNILFIK